jgi:hypothetical protein
MEYSALPEEGAHVPVELLLLEADAQPLQRRREVRRVLPHRLVHAGVWTQAATTYAT